MKQASHTPSKKARQEAINAARSRLALRTPDNELWLIINDYDGDQERATAQDRAAALVVGSVLEQTLETAILSHCITLDEAERKKVFQGGEDGPMNFAVKIRLAYALGIIGPNGRDDMDVMRHVRNFFAHEKRHLSFDDGDIVNLCAQLKWIHLPIWGGISPRKPTSVKSQYIETARHFLVFFQSTYECQRGQPVSYLNFPYRDLYA